MRGGRRPKEFPSRVLGVCGLDQDQLEYPSYIKESGDKWDSQRQYTIHHQCFVITNTGEDLLVLAIPVNILLQWECWR